MNEYCERAIAAMQADAPGADPVLIRAMPIVLKHLHALLDEIKLDHQQLYRLMHWLDGVGAQNDFIMLCDVLGLTMQSVAMSETRPGATPANVLGPFPKDDVPVYSNPVDLAKPGEAGQRVELRGTVRSSTGEPIAGAQIVVWQTNHDGKYENEDPDQPLDNFRARFETAADGSWSLSSVLPGPYAIGNVHGNVVAMLARLGRGRVRAAHVHYRVSAPGFEPLVSQIYFDGLPDNPTDCIFSPQPEIMVALKPHPEREGHLFAQYDIRLAPAERAAPGAIQ